MQTGELRKRRGLDQFQATVLAGVQWLTKYQKQIALVLLPVALVVAGGVAWKWYADRQAAERQDALAKVDVIWQDEERVSAKQREALQADIAKLDATAKPATGKDAKPGEPPKLSPEAQAKKTELEKKIEAIKTDHAPSRAAYKSFYEKNQGNAEGWAAGLRAASLLAQDRSFDEALTMVDEILKKSVSSQFYQIHGRFLAIGLLEEKGDYDKALAHADTLLSLTGKELKPQALLAKGRLQMLKASRDEAKATFDTIINDYASSAEAEKARGIKSLLN